MKVESSPKRKRETLFDTHAKADKVVCTGNGKSLVRPTFHNLKNHLSIIDSWKPHLSNNDTKSTEINDAAESAATTTSSGKNAQQETMAKKHCKTPVTSCNNPLNVLASLVSLEYVNGDTTMPSMDTSTAAEADEGLRHIILTEDEQYKAKIDVFLERRCFVAEVPLDPTEDTVQSPLEETEEIQLTDAQLAFVVDAIVQHDCLIQR